MHASSNDTALDPTLSDTLPHRTAAPRALAVSFAMLLLGLAASSPALARTHGPARHAASASCAGSTASHARQHRSACAKPIHSANAKPVHGAKTRARHGSRVHGGARHGAPVHRSARHGARVHGVALHSGAPALTTAKSPASHASSTAVTAREPAASCEDASAPLQVGDETFECQDGSEPSCADGSSYTISADGSTLLCGASLPIDSGAEAQCETAFTALCGTTPGGPVCPAAAQLGTDATTSCEGDGEPSAEGEDPASTEAQPAVGSRKQEASAS
jgi:hypothetical protein